MSTIQLEHVVANSPDLLKYLPMPKAFYSKYNTPLPQPIDLKEYFKQNFSLATGEGELQPVAPGGVRPVPEPVEHIQALPDAEEVPQK